MKNNHKFTLVNFQDHSCGLLYGDSTTNWMWSFWQNMYVTDLAVDGQIIGKAYCALWVGPGGSSDWCDELDHVHGGGDCDSPETNFTIDGTNWYSVWHYYSYGGPYDPTVDDGRRIARGIHGERVCQPNWRNRDNVEEVTKRIGMSGRPREKVPHGSAEFLEIMEAYDRLTELVSAVAAKEPPEQS